MAKFNESSLKYALIDQFLESATQHGISIYGPYVRDVLAPIKLQLKPYKQDADINLWVGNSDDWKKFVSANHHLEFGVTNQTSTTMKYEIFIMRHPICSGTLHTSHVRLPADFDVDHLMCHDYCKDAGFQLSQFSCQFTIIELLGQVKERKFRIINKDVSQSRVKELVDAGWSNNGHLIDNSEITDNSSREQLLEVSKSINKKLSEINLNVKSQNVPFSSHETLTITKLLTEEMLRLSAVIKGTLRLMDK